MIIVGIAFIIMGLIIFLIDIINKKKCKEITVGRVVDIYRTITYKSDGHKKYTYYPVFQYDADGIPYVKKSNNGSRFYKYEVGDEVEIKYNLKNPNKYYVKGSKSNIIISLVWVMLGILIIVTGIKYQ